MRIVLEKENELFIINNLFKKIELNVENYNWLLSDMTDTQIFNDNEYVEHTSLTHNIECLLIKGDKLKKLLEEFHMSFTFAVFTALPSKINHFEIFEVPEIYDNEDYWSENYVPTIPQAEFEIGFFDSSDIIFTGDKQVLNGFQKKANFISFKNYIETPI
ncbi:hypothetical protein NJE56_02255 [Bacillus pumilus]|uniref:hypothetical protein n=1 Tax=Bacillus pumilus TaxID=1408 RepID=UPI0029C3110C|nr:hypothetical protein [Bacillus pumilus]MDX5483764.1 hypothetical protein [Bacillus pumilus]